LNEWQPVTLMAFVGRSANRPQMSESRGELTSQDATRFCHTLQGLARSYCLALSRVTIKRLGLWREHVGKQIKLSRD
jgi:hypothetical protein